LKPVTVLNPFEPLLTYTEDRLAVRRDNRISDLILAVTFLYQMQRDVKHDEVCGDYIETTLDDIALPTNWPPNSWPIAVRTVAPDRSCCAWCSIT